MFIFRAIFWILVAFVVLAPGADLGRTANTIKSEALATGRQVVVDQLSQIVCSSNCAGGLRPGAAIPSFDLTMQDSSKPVPLPRPRPARMG
jgi:hypothetical protein